MAATAKKNPYAYAPSRVYSYSRAATAEALPNYEGEQAEVQPRQNPQQPQRQAHPAPRTRVQREPSPAVKRKRRLMPKLFSFAGVFAVAALLIGIVVRYAAIATEYANVNQMEAKITESKRRITELEVQLDEAVNLADARQTAEDAGLGYPTSDQIVDVNGTVGEYWQQGSEPDAAGDTGSGNTGALPDQSGD